ncbi:MAG: glycosyltransferase family 2 protein [Fusobacteriaceae bacterium]
MMKNNELVSIIVPVYNTEKYLTKCIKSILNQTYKNIEIIIIDDGSTDNCAKIIKKYLQNNKNIKYFKQRNQGQGVARNKGIQISQGKYIQFIDSDDYIEPLMVEKMINILKKQNLDFVNSLLRFDNGNKIRYYKKEFDCIFLEGKDIIRNFLNNKNIYTSPVNKLYKKEFLIKNKIEFPIIRAFEDSLFSLKVAYYARRTGFIQEAFYTAFEREGSTSRTISFSKLKLQIYSLKLQKKFLIENSFYFTGKIYFLQNILKIYLKYILYFFSKIYFVKNSIIKKILRYKY